MPGAEGREVVWFALLNLPSRNSSNKCTFHTKVSLIVLLSLDSPSLDCKLKSLCGPKAILTANAQQWRWPQIGFLPAVCVAVAHVPLPIVKFASIYFCHGDWGSSERERDERELMTPWFYKPTPRTGSLHVVVSCEWLVHCWYHWRQSSSLICLILTFERILFWGRNQLFSWQTWSIKNKAVPYNFPSQIQDPWSQNCLFQLQRADRSQLAQHLRGGRMRACGMGGERLAKSSSWL